MPAFIQLETPSGSVNGSNTIFTTAYTLYQLNYVVVDGALYTGTVTTSATTLTLADAPMQSIQVSYYAGATLTNSLGLTVADARDYLRRDTEFSTDLDSVSDSLFLDWANIIDTTYYRTARQVSPLDFATTLQVHSSPDATTCDLVTLDTLRALECGIYCLDQQGVATGRMLPRTTRGSSEEGYYIAGTTIHFTGHRTADYLIVYLPRRVPLTSMSDVLQIPQDEVSYIQSAFRRCYELWDAGQQITLQDALLQRATEELLGSLRPDSGGGLGTAAGMY